MDTPEKLPSPPSRCHTRVPLALAVLGGVLSLWHLAYYAPRTVDDMFIFLRYADQWVAGNGLVYNVGERVEGFSSPLWTVLLALGVALGIHGVVWAKTLAAIAYGALAWGVDIFGRERLGLSPLARAGVFVLLAANAYIASWTMYGLETPAYLALLIWTAVMLGRRMTSPTRANGVGLALVATGLTLARPEAPLYLLALGGAMALEPLKLSAIRERVIRSLAPALGVVAGFGGYLLFRHAYYGLWFPHTYYAKRGQGFSPEHLELLWGRGASVPEVILLGVGVLAAFWLATRARDRDDAPRSFVPLVVAGTGVFFVTHVIGDWMPNVRHLLPIWVFVPLAFFAAVDALAKHHLGGARVAAVGLTGIAVAAAFALVSVDSRYSIQDFGTHGGGERWVLPKTPERWQDAHRALRHVEPAHAQHFGPYDMGMITQVYRLFESDARPLDESWVISRDIGRVGWFSPVSVFESDGLFTPAIVASPAWQADRSVDTELLHVGFDRPVVMTELLNGWAEAFWGDPELRGQYEGFTPGDYYHLAPRDRDRPSPEQVLARYDAAYERLPSFYLMTLYGECVGCALERRTRAVHEAVEGLSPSEDPPAVPVATFDNGVILEGCTLSDTSAAPGEALSLRCTWQTPSPPPTDWQVFVHVETGGARITADHPPFGGLLAWSDMDPGQRAVDLTHFAVPEDAAAGEWRVLVGLWRGDRRLGAEGPHVAPDDRITVGRFEVTAP